MQRPLRIGTRGSKLALIQAGLVKTQLAAVHGWDRATANLAVDIVVVHTSGDRAKDADLTRLGGKGLFVKELEESLLNKTIDVAVHSMKDMVPDLPDPLEVAVMLKRADPRDALLLREGDCLEDLPEGARLGTSSPRRRAQILSRRPDLSVVPFRGNVDTRLTKLKRGEVDATILALAGLERLDLTHEIAEVFLTETMLPAVGQAAIGLEVRKDDAATHPLIAPLNDAMTHLCVTLERAFLAALGGSCRSAIAGLAQSAGGEDIWFRGQVFHPQGKTRYDVVKRHTLSVENLSLAEEIGKAFGEELKAKADPHLFDM